MCEENDINVIVLLSTITNVWLISTILYNRIGHQINGVILLLHLAGNQMVIKSINLLMIFPISDRFGARPSR